MVRSLIVDGASYGVEKQEWVCRATLKVAKAAKISFNIILSNLAIRIMAIFLLIDLFVFSL